MATKTTKTTKTKKKTEKGPEPLVVHVLPGFAGPAIEALAQVAAHLRHEQSIEDVRQTDDFAERLDILRESVASAVTARMRGER